MNYYVFVVYLAFIFSLSRMKIVCGSTFFGPSNSYITSEGPSNIVYRYSQGNCTDNKNEMTKCMQIIYVI